MDVEATRNAIGVLTAQLDDLETGSGLGSDLFADVVGHAANDRVAWEQAMALAVGLLNVALVLVGKLSAATGRPPMELMEELGLELQ